MASIGPDFDNACIVDGHDSCEVNDAQLPGGDEVTISGLLVQVRQELLQSGPQRHWDK